MTLLMVTQLNNTSLSQASNAAPPIWDTIMKSLLEANNQMKAIPTQQAMMANHQVMMQALNKVREKYFEEVYAFNILQASNHCLEEEVSKAELLKKARRRTEIKSIRSGDRL